jgi:hypothetical protein
MARPTGARHTSLQRPVQGGPLVCPWVLTRIRVLRVLDPTGHCAPLYRVEQEAVPHGVRGRRAVAHRRVPDRRRHARAVDAQQRVAEGHDAHHLQANTKRNAHRLPPGARARRCWAGGRGACARVRSPLARIRVRVRACAHARSDRESEPTQKRSGGFGAQGIQVLRGTQGYYGVLRGTRFRYSRVLRGTRFRYSAVLGGTAAGNLVELVLGDGVLAHPHLLELVLDARPCNPPPPSPPPQSPAPQPPRRNRHAAIATPQSPHTTSHCRIASQHATSPGHVPCCIATCHAACCTATLRGSG